MLAKFHTSALALMAMAGLTLPPAFAETPGEIHASFRQEASATSAFQGFSAARGEQLFKSKHGNDWSCASCHTENPAVTGKHAKTGKAIEPLAPSANAERFTNPKKVEKWFKRNCNDVLGRVCSAQEKGDVLAYLLNFKK